MGSVSVSSCRCCMFVSCVHPVAVLNAAFCMNCSLLMLVESRSCGLCFPLSSFVIPCRFGDLIIHCRQRGRGGILLLLLYALFNHPHLLIQVARVQKAQFSYRLDGLVP